MMPAEVAPPYDAAHRVLVLGCPGSGKTVLARRLAGALGLPAVHLDDEYWRPGWSRPDPREWLHQQSMLVARPHWVIDGNYLDSVELRAARADLVVVVDAPTIRCLARVLIRAYRIRKGDIAALPAAVRAQAATGVRVAATRDLPGLVAKVLAFQRRYWWPTVERARANPGAHFVIATAAGRARSRQAALHAGLRRRGLRGHVLALPEVVPFVVNVLIAGQPPAVHSSDRREGIV
jgi:hypothetical protein